MIICIDTFSVKVIFCIYSNRVFVSTSTQTDFENHSIGIPFNRANSFYAIDGGRL